MKLIRFAILTALLAASTSGCGVVTPSLPNAVPGFTLSTVKQVQNDGTLDATEKQQIVRALLGVQDDPAGNRLATFVLGLNIP